MSLDRTMEHTLGLLDEHARGAGADHLSRLGTDMLTALQPWAEAAAGDVLFALSTERGPLRLLFRRRSAPGADRDSLLVFPESEGVPLFEADAVDAELRIPRAGPAAGEPSPRGGAQAESRSIALPTVAAEVTRFLLDVEAAALERTGGVPVVATVTPTYLLTWNSKLWPWSPAEIEEQIARLDAGERTRMPWSTGVTKKIRPGDRFLMIRIGPEPRGVFASGRVCSGVTEKPHWEPERASTGATQLSVEIEFDELLNPSTTPILEQATLTAELPSVNWSPQASGSQIDPALVPRLEHLWQSHLRQHAGPLRFVHDLDQLRESMRTFSAALASGDARTKFAVFHPTNFVVDLANDTFAPAKWAGFRGMTPETYVALQRVQREHPSARGFSGSRVARHLQKLLGTAPLVSDRHTARLEEAFRASLGDAAVGNRQLDQLAFFELHAVGETGARTVNYWKISPGPKGERWQSWLEQGIASIGWDELGDLSGLTKLEFDARLMKALEGHPKLRPDGARQVWKFANIQPGDRVVANDGTTRVLGVGTVIGGYRFVPGESYGHHLAVRWDDIEPKRVSKLGWRKTLIRLKEADFNKIIRGEPVPVPPPPAPALAGDNDFDELLDALEDRGLHFPQELVANLLLSLQTKRFVILTGISGTGKTRLAQEIARHFDDDTAEPPDANGRDALAGKTAVAVMPYMLKYRRLVVPAELAVSFLVDAEPTSKPRLPIELPDGSRHSQAFHTRGETNLLQLLFSGAVKDWFLESFAVGDTVVLERVEDDSGESVLRLSEPPEQGPVVASAPRCAVVAVRPDWTDNRGLLGFFNPLTQQYVRTPFLDLLLRARAEAEAAQAAGRAPRPFFVILDEMNLARVEHYFSDFLSALESGEAIDLHTDERLELGESEQGIAIPKRLAVPPNLLFVGTVNVDETTYLFSPKVLDRAFTIEFNEVDLEGYGATDEDADNESGASTDSELSLPEFAGFVDLGHRPDEEDWTKFGKLADGALRALVLELNALLADENRHFGYRVANEIARFVLLAHQQGGREHANWVALDIALLQKVLPKLHGTQQELEGVLHRLFDLAVHRNGTDGEVSLSDWQMVGGRLVGASGHVPRLPRFATKVFRMLRRLRQQGFASFIE